MNAALRAFVRERAGRRCEYCRLHEDDADFLSFHVEHVVAKQHGGTDDPDSLPTLLPARRRDPGPKLVSIAFRRHLIECQGDLTTLRPSLRGIGYAVPNSACGWHGLAHSGLVHSSESSVSSRALRASPHLHGRRAGLKIRCSAGRPVRG
jgi:hypothetical protein